MKEAPQKARARIYAPTHTRAKPPGMRVNRRLAHANRQVNAVVLFYFRLAQKR